MSKYQDKLNEFGQNVLDVIETGRAPWQKSWKEGELLEIPKNATTDNSYRGVNLINLAMSGYNDPRWLTFVQAKKMDCKIRKGEKSRAGFYYSPSRFEKELENGKPVLDDNGKEKMVTVDKPVFRTFALFNATQVEGMEPYKQPEPSWKPEEKAEKLLNASRMTIVESQLDQAFYRPATHTIETPPKAQFSDKSKYYATIFHELGHATGHPSMLNRDKDTKSTEGKAKEELRAEISAWLVCTQIGIGYTPQEQDNNKNYVAGWLSALKDKDRAKELGFAMKDAEKIADYILALDKGKDQVLTDQQSIDQEPEKNHYIIVDESFVGISDKETLVDPWGDEVAKFDNPETALKAAISAKANMEGLEDDELSVYRMNEFGESTGPLVSTSLPIHMKAMWEMKIKTPFPEHFLGRKMGLDLEKGKTTKIEADAPKEPSLLVTKEADKLQAKADQYRADQKDLFSYTEKITVAMSNPDLFDDLMPNHYKSDPLSAYNNELDDTQREIVTYLKKITFSFEKPEHFPSPQEPVPLSESEKKELLDTIAPHLSQNSQVVLDGEKRRGEREPESKMYINVPYSEKDEAKALGAKWDKQEKSWFLEPGTDQAPFKKWLEPARENRFDMNKVFAQFQDQASRLGLKIDSPQADGKLHRVAVEGDKGGKKSGAYTLYPDGRPAGFIQNHKTGEKANFKYEGEIGKTVIPSKNKQARTAELKEDYAAAAKKAFGIYINADKTTDHPYLTDKKINGDKKYRVDKNNRLIIPAKNLKTNKIESLQFIGEDGQKQFLTGGKKSGNAYTIGEFDEQKPILLAEGFATGKTINDVSHLPAVVCFDANNLEKVAKQIRELMPSAELFICADNDHAKKNNVGVQKAQKAAKAVGAKVIIPKFTDESKKLGYTDFNDLAKCKMGKSRVQSQLKSQIQYLSKNKGIGLER
ncbi:zincin-like metallopeptidase domain-containing protein [Desulfobacter hydrogenophilus]|uniref:zincin-like metallopeptidase domain-containing protein n=1 Tax=Desulfobacter hydrogenophilus TaxID=2291 RepID=UPI001F5F5DD8|nr:zincin-like metallopeptidase domain-containing protein [Desulfobacter hydrogenophilus]